MPIEDEDKIKVFLEHLTTNGGVLYVHEGEQVTKEDVVINIQWLIDAFRCIISFDKKILPSQNCDKAVVSLLDEIRATGIFNRDDVQKLWTKQKFIGREDTLLAFLNYMDLIAQPLSDIDIFYIPVLFKDKSPEEIRQRILTQPDMTVSKTLCLDYRRPRSVMPPTLFDRILAAFIDKYHFLLDKDSVPFYGRGIALCRVDEDHSALIVCKDEVIKVTLLTSLPEIEQGAGGKIRTFLTSTVPRKARLLGQSTHTAKVGIDDDPIPRGNQTYYMINDNEIGFYLHGVSLKDKCVWDHQVCT